MLQSMAQAAGVRSMLSYKADEFEFEMKHNHMIAMKQWCAVASLVLKYF